MSTARHSLRKPAITALICVAIVAAYASAGVEVSLPVSFFVTLAPVVSVAMWLQKEWKRLDLGRIDSGWFFAIVLPLAILWYAWKTRSRSTWLLLPCLMALAFPVPALAALGYGLLMVMPRLFHLMDLLG